mgnify:CR=1 FL=1
MDKDFGSRELRVWIKPYFLQRMKSEVSLKTKASEVEWTNYLDEI